MKKVIRLTESDLKRIVKRVLMENEIKGSGTQSDPYLIKIFYSEQAKKNNQRDGNIKVFDLKVSYNNVHFKYSFPSLATTTIVTKDGNFVCDTKYITLYDMYLYEQGKAIKVNKDVFVSDSALSIFQSKCDAYASNKNMGGSYT